MRTKILRGRGFTSADRAGAPEVAIVSESMARVLWPGQDAIGQCFRMRTIADPCREVVGVAEDMAQRDLTSARYHYYVPIDQYPRTFGLGLLVRVRDNSSAAVESTRRALQAVMPGSSYVTIQPLEDLVEGVRRPWRLGATIFTVFGVLALAVAAVGLHGVVAHSVAERRHELGVRIALGAGRLNIVGFVVRGSAQLALAGAALGILAAAVSGRWIQPLLFQQSAIDLGVYAVTIVVLLLVTLLASAMPAWRALQADPTEALRGDS
jgi:ABC-type lipoprotein release transport system permease subunit